MRRAIWALSVAVAPLLATAGCTIERLVPLDEFACGSGGPCDDGGVTPADAGPRPDAGAPDADAGFEEDAGPTDGPPPDAGEPLALCLGIQPVPDDGLATGSSAMELNSYEPSCSAPGGRDLVFGFNTPGRLSTLEITLNGSSYDTAMHLYSDNCNPSNEVSCNDDDETWRQFLVRTSAMRLKDVAPGRYAVVVDAFGDTEAGTYLLAVRGTIQPGEPCEPQKSYLSCELGTCTDDGTGTFFCPDVLDCMDGIDADGDGMIDEDAAACTDPPTVMCPQINDPLINDMNNLTATVFDQGTIVKRQWEVLEQPVGSLEAPFEPEQDSTIFYTDLMGDYRLRYRALDDDLELSACEVAFTTVLPEELRVELVWNSDGPHHEHHAVLFLHLLHPSATAWFDATLDCFGTQCFGAMRDWGQQGNAADNPVSFGLIMGPQFTSVPVPERSGRYAIGVGYDFFGFRPQTEATVRLFCTGALVQEFSATLTNGNGFPEDNDFWKVAEVDFDNSGCQVFPFGNPDPVIVTGREAQMSR